MDGLSYLGLIIGFGAIITGQMIEGGSLHAIMNLPALLIVLGGTLGAVMLQTPWPTFKRAMKIVFWVFHPPKLPFNDRRAQLIQLTQKSRQFGLLSLEDQLDNEQNPLMRKGLELLMLGVDKMNMRIILEAEIDQEEYKNLQAVHVFESMGGYSPTIGIIGAVLGLIQVMGHLAQPSQLGEGIAVAFVATIYGVGLANLIFLPIANKLKSYIGHKLEYDAMLVEGLVAMAGGESPAMLTIKLNNFGLPHHNATQKK
jgi:chemotaxis protein MotA